MPLVVAAPPAVTDRLPDGLAAEGVELAVWDGGGAAPRDDIAFWVPAYLVGQAPDMLRSRLEGLPSLQVVQLLTAGVEPWPVVLPEGVTLCAGKSIHGGSTAELAVALTLALVRDLPTYVEQQAASSWQRHQPDTLAGKRVLVLGGGDIGARAAATFETLDASVTVVSRTGTTTLEAVPRLLPHTDVLLVALPLTDETRGLVGAAWLATLPDGAVVVNVARGPIVDVAALTEQVRRRRLRAGLDVTDPEPLPSDHPLWTLPGALVTPHVGGGATGWEDRAARLVADQVGRFRRGEPLHHVVTAGY